MPGFWEEIASQVAWIRASARTADDVIGCLTDGANFPTVFGLYGTSSGDAFFAGSGGDDDLASALHGAGWHVAWWNAGYWWSMRAPDGSRITYVEGDVYRGSPRNQMPADVLAEQEASG